MKKRNLLYSLLALVSLSAVVFLVNGTSFEKNDGLNTNSEATPHQGIDGAIEYYNLLKADPVTGLIDPKLVAQAKAAALKMPSFKASTMLWEEIGPNNVGGRVRGLLVDKDNINVLYAGGVSGGLWKSTTSGQSWVKINLADNIAISCIAQGPNGDIYVGTGEGLASASYSNVLSGMYGGGIYKSTDGTNFDMLPSTSAYALVNRIAIDMNNKVYIATSVGLKASTDGGTSWSAVQPGNFKDVKIAPNTIRVVATSRSGIGASCLVSDDGISFTQQDSVPKSGMGRIEIAISPTNPDYIYAVLATSYGSFGGIYMTKTGGGDWDQIAIGGSPSFDLFGSNNQGGYDNVCMVDATNPEVVFVGGIDMWKGVKTTAGPYSWTKITQWSLPASSSHFVHADQHVYIPVPGQANTFYAGTDGGIFKTDNGGASFVTLNKNFNITQFFAVANHPSGKALGGTQDNGTIFMDYSGNDMLNGRKILGGDGGWSAASRLNQDVIFASIYYSSISRSADMGYTFQSPSDYTVTDPDEDQSNFYSDAMIKDTIHQKGPFVSNVILWETTEFQNSGDTVVFIADTNYMAGDTIMGRSLKNNKYPFDNILSAPLVKGDTIEFLDPVQSRLFFGTKGRIYMTPEAIYFVNRTPQWYIVANTSGTVNKLRISHDGDHLFYTVGNDLYRLSGLLTARDSSSMDVSGSNYQLTNQLIYTASAFISAIVIDQADANRLAITLGGYSNSYEHVYYSDDATAAVPTFLGKGGDLPNVLPVYAGLIPVNNSTQMIIGTEEGMMMTDNITAASPVWYTANSGIDQPVPVYMLNQQPFQQGWKQVVVYDNGTPLYTSYPGVYNYGMIYAATHGRGLFSSSQYVSIPEIPTFAKPEKASLKLYPNPVMNDYANIELKLVASSEVNIQVYDINGRLVEDMNLGSRPSGLLQERINFNDLKPGVYMMHLRANTQTTINKFIVK